MKIKSFQYRKGIKEYRDYTAYRQLTLQLENGELQLTRATNAAMLDWASLAVTAASLPLPHLAVGAATDLHVAGKATVALPGVFTATGTGAGDVGQLSVG